MSDIELSNGGGDDGSTVENFSPPYEIKRWPGVHISDNGTQPPTSPVREYRIIKKDSKDPGYVNKFFFGTATTGSLRVEWCQARWGQIIPVNWSMVQMMHYMDAFIPLRYQVADAQNVILKHFIEGDFEWLFLLEHDVILPPNALILLDEYMREEKVPIVSGLYYTRDRPSLPLIFRGRGVSVYTRWKHGDLVWCDGIPTGCLLIHGAILREMWKDAKEYTLNTPGGQVTTRNVFRTPRDAWYDPETGQFNTTSGTSDLEWATNVIEGDYFEKAGWKDYADKRWPMLCDTRLFCRHINPDGEQFP